MGTKKRPQVVVVTGASAGVGRATVRAFAEQGAHIGLLARDRDRLEATRVEVEAAGGVGLVVPTDMADAQQVDDAAAGVEAAFGPIDVWVNCAFTSVFSPVSELRPEEVRRVTEVTYLGYVHGTMAALRGMTPRNRGTIVQVSSALAYRSIPLQAAYCGAKHAILGFTDSLRCELYHEHSKVRLTAVHLPAVNTPQFDWVLSRLPRRPKPAGTIYQPEVAARAILWAAQHNGREITVGLPAVVAIYGTRIAPGLLDRYLGKTGYDAQQADEPDTPDRPNNLWQPVAGDPGAHGRFDSTSRGASPQFWATTHQAWLLAGTAAGVAGAVLWRRNA